MSRTRMTQPSCSPTPDPLDLAEGLQIDGGLVLIVDTDWSGVNYYGFAPTESAVSFTPGK
jgi:hypothetical protein